MDSKFDQIGFAGTVAFGIVVGVCLLRLDFAVPILIAAGSIIIFQVGRLFAGEAFHSSSRVTTHGAFPLAGALDVGRDVSERPVLFTSPFRMNAEFEENDWRLGESA
jgi:hypothetical protein